MNQLAPKFVEAYFNIAYEFAALSTARRLQVGAIIVKDWRIISSGYNGTPSGWDNTCEEEVPFSLSPSLPELRTKAEVIHAEANSLYKLARSHESGLGAAMFLTHSPCMECSKGIFMSGISKLYYDQEYRDSKGIEFLKKCGIEIYKRGYGA